MEINKLSDAFTKIGRIDLSKWDFPKYHLPEIEIPTVETIDPEDAIVGDIKKELQTQNSLVSQQVGILIEQNRLLTEKICMTTRLFPITKQRKTFVEAEIIISG